MSDPVLKHAKIVIVRAQNSEKTSIVHQYVYGEFLVSPSPITHSGFFLKMLIIKNQQLKLEILDPAGQEKYRVLTTLF
jgi:GTPase SAR1 family protein